MADIQNTKLIPLTQGKFAIVDTDDYERISKHKWYYVNNASTSIGYANTNIGNKKTKRMSVRMHRMILNAKTGEIIDHINHNNLDNRKQNLRFCTRQENNRNRKRNKCFISKYKGVFLRTGKNYKNPWTATIQINIGTRPSKSGFKTQEDAAAWYNEMAKKYFGDFAYLNTIS